jgi:hypothetical protein
MSFYEEEILREEAPDAPGAEDWIKKHKPEFKRRYGSNWARVLYAKAWLLYGKNAKNGVRHEVSHVTTVSMDGPTGTEKKITQQTTPGGALDVQKDGEDDSDKKQSEGKKGDEHEVVTEAATSFKPPADVVAAAKRGLEMRREHKRAAGTARRPTPTESDPELCALRRWRPARGSAWTPCAACAASSSGTTASASAPPVRKMRPQPRT